MTNTRRTLAALALAGAALTSTGTAHAADPGDKGGDQASSTSVSTSGNNLLHRTTNALSPLTSLLPVNVNDIGR
ncbi:hypothetical protein ACFT4A_02595 [Streptomyces sp. NPDC057099]|uniref:hypothetical protein n=1 Tax=Streptomyces sp. NPDC057099 TaxID=3346019 RepID=UPI00363F6584